MMSLAASRWFSMFSPFRASIQDRRRIAEGLMMYETDHATRPVTFRFYAEEGKAQYSLTRSETAYLAALLDDFLKKGPTP